MQNRDDGGNGERTGASLIAQEYTSTIVFKSDDVNSRAGSLWVDLCIMERIVCRIGLLRLEQSTDTQLVLSKISVSLA